MKKKVRKTKKKPAKIFPRKNICIAVIVILLLLAAVWTGAKTDFLAVAIGVLIGFLLAPLLNQMKKK
jgi:predicted PurR-regulated permease PerM